METLNVKNKIISYEDAVNYIYKHDIFMNDLTIGMSLSLPVIRVEKIEKVISFFIYPSLLIGSKNKNFAGRPIYWISLNAVTGKVVFFSHCLINDFAPDIPFYEKVEGFKKILNVAELQQQRKLLIEKYDQILEFLFNKKEELSEDQRLVIKEYLDIFDVITPEGHKPFYEALGKDFFIWLKNAR